MSKKTILKGFRIEKSLDEKLENKIKKEELQLSDYIRNLIENDLLENKEKNQLESTTVMLENLKNLKECTRNITYQIEKTLDKKLKQTENILCDLFYISAIESGEILYLIKHLVQSISDKEELEDYIKKCRKRAYEEIRDMDFIKELFKESN